MAFTSKKKASNVTTTTRKNELRRKRRADLTEEEELELNKQTILPEQQTGAEKAQTLVRPKGTGPEQNVLLSSVTPEQRKNMQLEGLARGAKEEQTTEQAREGILPVSILEDIQSRQQQVEPEGFETPAQQQEEGPITEQQRAEENVASVRETLFNFAIDPLAPISKKAEQAVLSAQNPVLRAFNEKAFRATESLRASSRLFTDFAAKQIGGRVLGGTKNLREKYGEASARLTNAEQGMDDVITAVQTGMPIAQAEALFADYERAIIEDHRSVKKLTQSDVNNLLENGIDTLSDFDRSVNLSIPEKRRRFELAKLQRSLIA